jgi:hypothetical protein
MAPIGRRLDRIRRSVRKVVLKKCPFLDGHYLTDFSAGLARLEAGLQQAIDMIDRVQRAEDER